MAENVKEVEEFIQELMSQDETAKARHFAEVFAQLMEFPIFSDFVRENFMMQYYLDKETGALMVHVEYSPTVPSEAETEMAGAFDAMHRNKKL